MDTPSLYLPSVLELKIDLTDEQFWQLCQDNDDLQFEQTATGELIIMSPTGSETGERNADLIFQLKSWSRQNNLGKVFDSSAGFKLPNGAVREAWATPIRSPDASWVKLERWNGLTQE